MRIILSPSAGFCYGVRRAVESAAAACEKARASGQQRVYSLGPVVHNPQVMVMLRSAGLATVAGAQEAREGVLILPSHGAGPTVRDAARMSGCTLLDLTCPHVEAAARTVRTLAEDSYPVIIVGDEGHAEVRALLEWAGGKARVVSGPEEAAEKAAGAGAGPGDACGSKVAVVAQTTQSPSTFARTVAALVPRFQEVRVFNTICGATQRRQEDARRLAGSVDAMVVIGGRESANTRRLYQAVKEVLESTFLVEDGREVDRLPLGKSMVVGVTAGASTPNWVIEEVISRMKELHDETNDESANTDNPLGAGEGEPSAEPEAQPSEPEAQPSQAEAQPSQAEAQPSQAEAQPSQAEAQPSQAEATEPSEPQEPGDKAPPLAAEPELVEGDIVEATIVSIGPKEVLADVGSKSEGVIPLSELSTRPTADPSSEVSVGEKVLVKVVNPEGREGHPVLSRKGAMSEINWRRVVEAHDQKTAIMGTVTSVVKGGVLVDVGVRGFVPASHLVRRPGQPTDSLVGQALTLKVIELEADRKNVVLSERIPFEENLAREREASLAALTPGETREGVVKKVVDFGAFVDIGNGLEGLVHVSDLSWGRVRDAHQAIQKGQRIKVKVLDVDRERERISLGIKQLQPDPWDTVAEKYPVGSVVTGTVTKLVDFGAFVELEQGIEGLVHISQLADRRVAKPDEVVASGQNVRVKVVKLRPEDRRIGLSMREAEAGSEFPESQNAQGPRHERRPGEKGRRERQQAEGRRGDAGTSGESASDAEQGPQGPTLGDVFGELFEKK